MKYTNEVMILEALSILPGMVKSFWELGICWKIIKKMRERTEKNDLWCKVSARNVNSVQDWIQRDIVSLSREVLSYLIIFSGGMHYGLDTFITWKM